MNSDSLIHHGLSALGSGANYYLFRDCKVHGSVIELPMSRGLTANFSLGVGGPACFILQLAD